MLPTDNARGALLMVGSMTAFTLNDTFMKALSGDVALAQAIFLRGVATSALLLLLAAYLGQLRLRLPRGDVGPLLLRSLAEAAAAYFFLTALFNMPIANATAILQALPLALTMAGALFLGERVGWRRWTATGIGFVGVVMIVQPGGDGFTGFSLYALAAVASVTLRDIVVRRISADLPSLTVALAGAVVVTGVFGLISAAQPWAPIPAAPAALLAGAAFSVLAAYILSVGATRLGEVSAVAPFRYTGLVVALILGYAVFGDWPDAMTLAGGVLIVASGLYTFWRERALAGRRHDAAVRERDC